MRHFRLRFPVVLWIVLQASLAHGQTQPSDPVSEAIREHVDALRYADERDVHGAQVVLREPVARVYEGRQFRSAWSDPIRLNQLIVAIGDVEADGLDPRDYHLDALTAIRDELRAAKKLSTAEQADLDLIATDALGLAMYHVHAGKVDPVKISAQWNFDERPLDSGEALRLLGETLASGRISETLAAARPQHRWYEMGRVDARVAVLRKRLEVTGDLPSSSPTAGDDTSAATATSAEPATNDVPDAVATPAVNAGESYDSTLVEGVKRFQMRH
jgi:murein L,D-transpeptidase YcbB/YkuD